jgi:hypothetical protein
MLILFNALCKNMYFLFNSQYDFFNFLQFFFHKLRNRQPMNAQNSADSGVSDFRIFQNCGF